MRRGLYLFKILLLIVCDRIGLALPVCRDVLFPFLSREDNDANKTCMQTEHNTVCLLIDSEATSTTAWRKGCDVFSVTAKK